MAYVEIKHGKSLMKTALAEEAMSVGRLPGNFIVINDPDISRRHCVIERVDDRFSLYDLGSRNGTKVNGARVQRVDLNDGDVITLGTTELRFVDQPLPAAARAGQRRHLGRRVLAGMGVLLILAGAFVGAWAMGLLGEAFAPADLHAYMDRLPWRGGGSADDRDTAYDRDTADDGEADEAGDASGAPETPRDERTADSSVADEPATDEPRMPPPADDDRDEQPGSNGDTAEPAVREAAYRAIPASLESIDLQGLVGRLVSAQFLGRPTVDDRVVNGTAMVWELPPDGTVTAVLEADGAHGRDVLSALADESMLLDVRMSGTLERGGEAGRYVLRVGVVEVLHAWGARDESLQAATRQLLGRREIINSRWIARVTE